MLKVDELLRLSGRTAASLRRRGLRTTCEAVLATIGDYRFDVRYGTDTRETVSLGTLDIRSDNRRRAVDYSATKPRIFGRFMTLLRPDCAGTFVDLGCGKGRVLLLAANFGYRKVVGVEFSPELCRIARSNVAAYRQRTNASTEFDVFEADVCRYRMRDDETVYFLFHPFDAVVMRIVLDNLEASFQRRPRMMSLLYYNPVCAGVLEQGSLFRKVAEARYAWVEAWLYRTQ
jgi:SAM-dependent methyltransferase